MTRMTGSVPDGRITSRPAIAELFLASIDRFLHAAILKRLAALIAHVREKLRHRLETLAHFADRTARRHDDRQHLQRRDEAVARRYVVGHDDMAGLFAADVEAVLAHVLDDVAVTDRRPGKRQAKALQVALEDRGST